MPSYLRKTKTEFRAEKIAKNWTKVVVVHRFKFVSEQISVAAGRS
jgi:hypothetical protein